MLQLTTMQDLQQLRQQIDELDPQIVELIAQRMQIVAQVGAYKKQHSIPPLDNARWQQVLQGKIELAKKQGVEPELIAQIYELIHEFALKAENEIAAN